MNKKIIISSILLLISIVFVFFMFLQNKNKNNTPVENENQIILFYGEGCPHCAVVDKYIEDNNIEDKVDFIRKEVWSNRNNLRDLKKKAEICKLPTNSIGVPFLWNGEGGCLMGEKDVNNFFQQKINEL